MYYNSVNNYVHTLSERKVRIELYKEYCTQFHLFLTENVAFVINKHLPGTLISITQYHKVLAHTWQFTEMNDECGLPNIDEAGLERRTYSSGTPGAASHVKLNKM